MKSKGPDSHMDVSPGSANIGSSVPMFGSRIGVDSKSCKLIIEQSYPRMLRCVEVELLSKATERSEGAKRRSPTSVESY